MTNKLKQVISILTITLLFSTVTFGKLPSNFKQVVFFGDSLSDMGNFHGGGYDSYINPDAPVTNWENGKTKSNVPGKQTWAEFLTQEYYHTTASPSSQNGNDWAISGDTTFDVSSKQVIDYLAKHPTVTDPNNTLFIIWAGANDIQDKIGNHTDPTWIFTNIISPGTANIAIAIIDLYQAGGRNFLVVGLPDMSLTPLFSNPHHPIFGDQFYQRRDGIHAVCLAWDEFLFSHDNSKFGVYSPLVGLKQLFANMNIYVYDFLSKHGNDKLHQIVNNPTKYGFVPTLTIDPPKEKQSTFVKGTYKNNQLEWYFAHDIGDEQHTPPYGQQYDDPDQFIFHNSIHPTTHTDEIMAETVEDEAILF